MNCRVSICWYYAQIKNVAFCQPQQYNVSLVVLAASRSVGVSSRLDWWRTEDLIRSCIPEENDILRKYFHLPTFTCSLASYSIFLSIY